jgi:hypothetical protein
LLSWLLSGCLALLLGAATSGAAQPAFNARLLSVRYNLLSNPSFEAPAEGQPPSWEILPAGALQFSPETPRHGRVCLQTAGAPAPFTLSQKVPACPRATYELTAWLRVSGESGGVGLALQALQPGGQVLAETRTLAAPRDGWQEVQARLTVPRLSGWVRVVALTAPAGATVAVDAVRLARLTGPATYGPLLAHLAANQKGANWALLTWDSEETSFNLHTRQSGDRPSPWVTRPGLRQSRYSWQLLEPDMNYEVRVSLPQPPHYDETGQQVTSPLPVVQTPVLPLRTSPWTPRKWGRLQLWPTRHLDTFPGDQSYPCVEGFREALYVTEVHGGGVHLSRVLPPNLQVDWTRPLLPPQPEQKLVYTDLDTCVYADRLYLAATRQSPAATAASRTSLVVAIYDLALDKPVGEPLVVTPTRPEAVALQGAVMTYRDQVWLTWLEAFSQQGQRHTDLVIAPLQEGGVGERQVWKEGPSSLFGPALTIFEEQLAILFTDLTAVGRLGYEPLGLVRFDGLSFARRQRLTGLGSSRYPDAHQFGRHLALVYRSDAAYAIYDRRYQDLRLALLGPAGLANEDTAYVADMTYNTAPSITMLGNDLWVAYQKFSHAYGDPADPAVAYGTFLGRLSPSTSTR